MASNWLPDKGSPDKEGNGPIHLAGKGFTTEEVKRLREIRQFGGIPSDEQRKRLEAMRYWVRTRRTDATPHRSQ